MTPTHAMLLAAGLGLRMRPLTEETAKPLLPLAGRPLLDHALDQLATAGVRDVVVNVHWQADRVAAHLRARPAPPRITLRPEASLLDTGGAVRAALDDRLLGANPFFVVNGDAFWLDGPVTALDRLAQAYDPATTDAVLLVQRAFLIPSEIGLGDFMLDQYGLVRRRAEGQVAPYVYAGLQLLSPALFDDLPLAPFSMNAVWDRAMAAGRLLAVVHDGLWFHLSTPNDLTEAETHLHDADPATT